MRRFHLLQREARKFIERYSTRKCLGPLTQELRRRAPQDKKTGDLPRAVREDAKGAKELWTELHFVEDYKTTERRQSVRRFLESAEICVSFKVKESGFLALPTFGDDSRQGAFSNLARPQQGHDWTSSKEPHNLLNMMLALQHTSTLYEKSVYPTEFSYARFFPEIGPEPVFWNQCRCI